MPPTIKRFLELRSGVRALIYLYWIYSFTIGMVEVFTQIFLYQKFTDVSLNVVATIVFYTGIMLGFCIPGLIASLGKVNIKSGFMWSFLCTGLSLLYFPHTTNIQESLAAMLLWGFGQGLFWLTVNTFELVETKSGERDFYSSMLNVGTQVLSLAGPAVAALLIWLSDSIFSVGTYSLLFTIAPAVYLLGFFCFSSIRDYRPERIRLADVTHYLTDRKNQAAQVYTFGMGVQQTIGTTIPPLLTLLILGSALHVGIYNMYFSVFSAVCIFVMAKYRTERNRILIYGVTMLPIVLSVVWLGYSPTFIALMVYTVVKTILSPIQNVSSHVIDLDAMEIGRSDADFYATMLLRDFFLWIWRVIGGVLLLFLISTFGTRGSSLSIGMYLWAGSLLVTYAGAILFTKTKHHTLIHR